MINFINIFLIICLVIIGFFLLLWVINIITKTIVNAVYKTKEYHFRKNDENAEDKETHYE